ncbi:hypothetical protein [Rubrivirga sp. IMCC43871]|uniref:hypothetical protein n=1 Tax=Rubrivirga sp. IMCC43871 TaxID=3391575 RepID=UPI0039900478
MRFPLVLALALAAAGLSGCAATMQSAANTQYADDFFDGNALARGGLALLPVTAGQGQEAYRRPFGNALNAAMDSIGRGYGINVTPWDRTMRAINDADLTSDYNEALRGYRETSIIDAGLLRQIGEHTGRRYILYTLLGDFEAGAVAGRNVISGDLEAHGAAQTAAFAQIWDTQSGDVVWEGRGEASQRGSTYTRVDSDPAAYTRAVAVALADEIMGR